MSVHAEARKVTTHTLQEMKRAGEPITMLTAYDYSSRSWSMPAALTSSWSVILRPT